MKKEHSLRSDMLVGLGGLTVAFAVAAASFCNKGESVSQSCFSSDTESPDSLTLCFKESPSVECRRWAESEVKKGYRSEISVPLDCSSVEATFFHKPPK